MIRVVQAEQVFEVSVLANEPRILKFIVKILHKQPQRPVHTPCILRLELVKISQRQHAVFIFLQRAAPSFELTLDRHNLPLHARTAFEQPYSPSC